MGALVLVLIVITLSLLAGLWRGGARWRDYLRLPFLVFGVSFAAAFIMEALENLLLGGADTLRSSIAGFIELPMWGLAGYWIGRRFAGDHPGVFLLRGARLIEILKPSRGGRDANDPSVLRLGGLPVPASDETKHFKLIGTTGTGKSTAIRSLLAAALARGDRAVIADPDGGYLERFYDAGRGDVILNPFDRRSAKWDLYAEIRQPYDVEQLARSLIPDAEGQSSQEWRSYARTFFSAVMKQSRALGTRQSAELYRLLTVAPEAELRVLLDGTPAQPFLAEGNARMFGSIRSVTGAAIAALPYIEAQTAVAFSVRSWIERGQGVLFIPYRADQIAAMKDLIATWMRVAIFQTLSGAEGDLRLWFIIDELDAVGRIDGLKDALARLRKFGGRCILGLQSIGQASAIYGQGEAQTIIENCGNAAIFRCSASEDGGTSRFASKLIGEREIVRQVFSEARSSPGFFSSQGSHTTTTRSHQYATESAVMASEIEQLADGAGYLKFASHPEWFRVQFPDDRFPRVAPAFVPFE